MNATVFKTVWNYLLSAVIIWLCLLLGNYIQAFFDLTFPASIIGMLILLTMLILGIVKIEWIEATSSLFLRYLLLLFTPISVGLMAHFSLLLDNLLPILIASVGVTALVMVLVSLLLHKIVTSSEPKSPKEIP